jgi:hypothetical protein
LFLTYCRWRALSSKAAADRNVIGVLPNTYPIVFHEGYEPYLIVGRDQLIPYDERFRGYGQNKHVQLKWLQHKHPNFHVLLDHFVIAQEHANSKTFKTLMGSATVFARNMMHAFHNAMQDMHAGRMPLVSDNSARLLAANGWEGIYAVMPPSHPSS